MDLERDRAPAGEGTGGGGEGALTVINASHEAGTVSSFP
jgi:hypothetical protein